MLKFKVDIYFFKQGSRIKNRGGLKGKRKKAGGSQDYLDHSLSSIDPGRGALLP